MIAFLLSILVSQAQAQVHVNGYLNSHGTYVSPYVRTAPDSNVYNNNNYLNNRGSDIVRPYQQPTINQPGNYDYNY